MIVCLITGAYQIVLAKAYITNRNCSILTRSGNSSVAVTELQSLNDKLKKADSYWVNYGNALAKQNDYKGAIGKYLNAINIKPLCETYLLLSHCYLKINKPDSAITACFNAKNISPNRMLPTFALMQIFISMKDTLHAVAQAKELITIRPKIQSKEAMFYKIKAMQVFKQFNGEERIN
jgi:tetratricopeptide (TPR) repeat protein